MARSQALPPSASALSASMRDLGYSLETAVADLIDNSISAGATKIDIVCDLTREQPSLEIIDDGHGMSEEELIAAMRHGSASPAEVRAPNDLGRFGLGLKTASFSQCRRLTVATAQHGAISAAEWDLDVVNRNDEWLVSILDPEEIDELPFMNKLAGTGTIVLWRDLDRLFEDQTGTKRDEIVSEKIDSVERHLSLVFHRFLAGEVRGRKRLAITINGHVVEPFDPFCRSNSATQVLPEEVVRLGDSVIRMQPYILPHHSKLSARGYDYYKNRSDFLSNQGAYVYRNGRLMVWGDWFRLIPKGEATKLARVQIDFPSALDEMWTIDIKKSRARPPYQVRERLRQIIGTISDRSTTIHRKRGRKLFDEVRAPIWERYADRGTIRYSLNHEHPLVESLLAALDDREKGRLSMLLDAISSSLPIEMIYSDFSVSPRAINQTEVAEESVAEKLQALKELLCGNGIKDAEGFRDVVESTRSFADHMPLVDKFIEEEFA